MECIICRTTNEPERKDCKHCGEKLQTHEERLADMKKRKRAQNRKKVTGKFSIDEIHNIRNLLATYLSIVEDDVQEYKSRGIKKKDLSYGTIRAINDSRKYIRKFNRLGNEWHDKYAKKE